MLNNKLIMEDIIKAEDSNKFNLYLSELLHAIKYKDYKKYDDLYNYNVKKKEEYSELEYRRLVQLAAVMDFKFIGSEYMDKWFKSGDLYLEKPFFSSDIDREYLFFFAPQQFMRHNVFYDRYELDVL